MLKNKAKNASSNFIKSSKNILVKRNISKVETQTPQEKSKNINLNREEINDEEKMTAQTFLNKLENNGIKKIKISQIVLLILFIFVVIRN